jgi:hypothetical protein
MKKNMSPSPRVGPLPVWGIGLAVAVAGMAALLFRNRNDLVSTGLELVALQGLLLWLGTCRVRYLTLAMLAASWIFAATVATASAFALHSWIRASGRLAAEPAALAAAIVEYEDLARRCARCSVIREDGTKLAVETAIAEVRADSQKIRSLLQSQITSSRRAFAICATFAALFVAVALVLQRWYRAWRIQPEPTFQ